MGKSYYKTKADVYSAPLKDKIDRLLYINAKSCEQSLKNIIRNKDYSLNDVKEKNLEIGPLVVGEAYFHEVNQYYDVIGFLVKSECEFKGSRLITHGFRSIYFGNCDDMAPVDFDEGTSLEPCGTIGNGLGDRVEILEELNSKEEVNKCIKENNIDINKYLKEYNLLLADRKEKKKKDKNMEV